MHPFIFQLAQLTFDATVPATQPADPKHTLHFDWSKWAGYYSIQTLISGILTFVLTVLAGYLLARIFKKYLERSHLERTFRLAVLAIAVYSMFWAWHPVLMLDQYDYGSIVLHRAFAGAMVLVGLRILDWLVIVPLLTRGGKVALPRFVHQIILVIVYIFAILGYCSWAFDLNIDRFLAGSAVLSIVLGLALQETLGNFFSGMVMQASTPFQIGDYIECGGSEGRVIDMNWRAVTIHTAQDNYVLIPNSIVAKEKIINYHSPTSSTVRSVTVGVDYGVPPNEVKAVLIEAAKETPGVLADPPPGAGLAEFGDSAIVYGVGFRIANPRDHGGIENQVRTNIWYRLKKAGYSIPFPTRTVELVDLEKRAARDNEAAAQQRLKMFSNTTVLAKVSPESLAQLAEVTQDVLYAAGQVLYRQGDQGSNLYILREGTVESTMKLPDGSIANMGQMTAPDFFGEYSATTDKPRPTTLRAVTDIKCIRLTRDQLRELLNSNPDVMAHVSQIVSERAAARAKMMEAAGDNATAKAHAQASHSVLDGMKALFGRFHMPLIGKADTKQL